MEILGNDTFSIRTTPNDFIIADDDVAMKSGGLVARFPRKPGAFRGCRLAFKLLPYTLLHENHQPRGSEYVYR